MLSSFGSRIPDFTAPDPVVQGDVERAEKYPRHFRQYPSKIIPKTSAKPFFGDFFSFLLFSSASSESRPLNTIGITQTRFSARRPLNGNGNSDDNNRHFFHKVSFRCYSRRYRFYGIGRRNTGAYTYRNQRRDNETGNIIFTFELPKFRFKLTKRFGFRTYRKIGIRIFICFIFFPPSLVKLSNRKISILSKTLLEHFYVIGASRK